MAYIKKTQPGAKTRKQHIKELIEAIVIALVLALGIRAFVIQAFKIPSGSMEDTLLIGDHLIVSKFAYGFQVPKPAMIDVYGVRAPFFETSLAPVWGEIKRGDVIVFRFPADRTKDYIKRVAALPGETIEMRGKVIYVNGKVWDERFGVNKGGQFGETVEKNINFGPITVPDGHVFVMGDNRDRSYDSRFWGTVPIREIKGKAFILYWSWDSASNWIRFSRIGGLIR
ncbi:MAG: signal peptidase I [Deltaproteobacteria bacterium]|nr:signal peptidase I [Deltaproteobacteria bacterium]